MKILIAGKKGSGKSTLANLLHKRTGYKVFAFADALKRACALVSEIPLKNFDNPEFKEKPFLVPMRLTKHTIDAIFMLFGYNPEQYSKYTESLATICVRKHIVSIRDFLQFIGTDILRNFDPNVHVNYLKNNIEQNAIVADVRFKNEAESFNDEPHLLIIMERNTGNEDTHVSEQNIEDLKSSATIIINNSGSINDLELEVDKIVTLMESK